MLNCPWYFRLAVCLVTLLPKAALAQGNTCSKAAIQRATKEVAVARKALLALPIGNGLETQVSSEANQAIGRMKERLGAMVGAYMRCVSIASPPDSKQIARDLSSLAHAHRLPRGIIKNENIPKDFGKYGSEVWLEARITPDARRLVSITATFAIECGSDTMLIIFAPNQESWEDVLRWESPPYEEVSGAFEAFQYGISPPNESGLWYLVAAHIMPWCSSTWSRIKFEVLRPAAKSPKPEVLFTGADSIWWGNEDFGQLVVNAADFDLRFHAQSIDSGVHNRVFIRHYEVAADSVQRVQPVAVSPRDFVDEWIVSPWVQAANWSAPGSIENLRQIHEHLQSHDKSGSDFEYRAVRKCSDALDDFQVEVCHAEDKRFFFRVNGQTFFTMMGVTNTPDSKCAGSNILDTMDTR